MEPGVVNKDAASSNNDSLTELPKEMANTAPSPSKRDHPGTTQACDTHKKRRQRQFKKALAAMMESLETMFDSHSDADVSDLDEAGEEDPVHCFDLEYSPSHINKLPSSNEMSPHRGRSSPQGNARRRTIEDDTESRPLRPVERKGTLLEEVKSGPIGYETEFYEYTRSPDGDAEEPNIVETMVTQAPAKISRTGARSGTDPGYQRGYIFKVVHMYAVPLTKEIERQVRRQYSPPRGYLSPPPKPRLRSRSRSATRYAIVSRSMGRNYSRGRPQRPFPVTASVGNYLVVYSDVIISAIRKSVQSYPGLSRTFDYMIIPAPYSLIIHYRRELEEFNDKLPDEKASTSVHEGPTLHTDANHDSDFGDGECNTNTVEVLELERKKHIPELLNYVFTSELKAQIDAEMSLRQKPVPMCTYAMVWLLFKPGTTVYAWGGGGLDSAYIVDWYELEGLYAKDSRTRHPGGLAEAVHPPVITRGESAEFNPVPKSVIIKLHYLEFDGEHVGRRPRTITISPFEGEKEIFMLPVYPVEFARSPNLRESLIERGRKYIRLCQPSYMVYQGDTIATAASQSRKVNGRVMIDSQTFYTDGELADKVLRLKVPTEDGIIVSETSSGSESSALSDSRYHNRRKRRNYRRRIRDYKKMPNRVRGMAEYDLVRPGKTQFKEEHLMLFPSRVWGFVLRERRWYLLNIENLKNPVFQENIIDDLVLKDEAKNLIQALSNTHTSTAAEGEPKDDDDGDTTTTTTTTNNNNNNSFGHFSADIIRNKGEGRIFLLHGKPGVGKTSTAECVAESARVPLLAITCGDLGIEPNEVEGALMKWFKLATQWKAVLLLDEADVYLESRMSGDLARNSLVSIFLRALEYYQGVLFLTTNRVGTFDEAMLSRIHVVLHYADFDDSERQRIWTVSFRKLGEERPDVKVGPGLVDYALENRRVLDLRWNGREIRNAFNTTVALAEFDAERRRRSAGGKETRVVLERSHLVQVVKMSEEFKRYMKSTRGLDESQLAKAMKLRDDAALQKVMQVANR
ncbi:hypothetical protein H2204_007050 [Knufia peltigerae]|uniref:AAA+ ATPase domain-containing protein n=1 Tax=Knufia peltigerae TaxID=1002370 RepID=A0AA39CY99_9EURO|nr:hypothetical protein H2204_007050 [Knufia peltigerae]